MEQVYIAHCTDVDALAFNIERVEPIRWIDAQRFIAKTTEDGRTEDLIFTIGIDAAEKLSDAFDIIIKRLECCAEDALNQMWDAFDKVRQDADCLDGSSGHDGFTVAEYAALQGALIADMFAKIGSQVQLNLLTAMKLAREEAD